MGGHASEYSSELKKACCPGRPFDRIDQLAEAAVFNHVTHRPASNIWRARSLIIVDRKIRHFPSGASFLDTGEPGHQLSLEQRAGKCP